MAQSGMEFQLIFGLALAIFILIFLVVKTKVHAVIALVLTASIAGLVGGMMPADVINAITTGFGKTLSTIGLVIGFGVMMGRVLEVSGAAEQMAYSLIRWLGEKKEEWALVITGYIVSVPIFCDSAFVILNPLVKALARNSGKSILSLGIAFVRPQRECPVFCVFEIWSMLRIRSKDYDDIKGTAGRASEGLRAA